MTESATFARKSVQDLWDVFGRKQVSKVYRVAACMANKRELRSKNSPTGVPDGAIKAGKIGGT